MIRYLPNGKIDRFDSEWSETACIRLPWVEYCSKEELADALDAANLAHATELTHCKILREELDAANERIAQLEAAPPTSEEVERLATLIEFDAIGDLGRSDAAALLRRLDRERENIRQQVGVMVSSESYEHARQVFRETLKRAEAAEAALAEARKALAFYADATNWQSPSTGFVLQYELEAAPTRGGPRDPCAAWFDRTKAAEEKLAVLEAALAEARKDEAYLAELPDCIRLAKLGDFGPLDRLSAAIAREGQAK